MCALLIDAVVPHGGRVMRVSSRCGVEEKSEVFHVQTIVCVKKVERADNVEDEQNDENDCS